MQETRGYQPTVREWKSLYLKKENKEEKRKNDGQDLDSMCTIVIIKMVQISRQRRRIL